MIGLTPAATSAEDSAAGHPGDWVGQLFPEVRPRTSEDVSTETLHRILDGVEDSLLVREPSRVTVTSILGACGVSRTNFYRYFRDREHAINAYALREIREGLLEIWSRDGDVVPSRGHVAKVATDMVLAFRGHPVTAALRQRAPDLLAGLLSRPSRSVLEGALGMAARDFYIRGARGKILLEALTRLIMAFCLAEAVTVPDTRSGLERFFRELLPEG